jgi:cytochrome c oxidase assembly protein subunit 15
MDALSLVNLSPAARMMWMGVLVAVLPLWWVWRRQPHATTAQRLKSLTLVTLVLTFDLVLFGAFTRLTDSGLGCPDWPGCYGAASPIGAHADISAAQAALPSGPVTLPKAWVEMVHRYLATGVGVLITVLAVVTWLQRRRTPVSPLWPALTWAWVCVQGAFGALTVTMKLFPAIVTLHLLFGLGLLVLLRVQSVQYARADGAWPEQALPRASVLATWAVFAGLWLQIALGGWVSTNYAVLACSEFPTCQGGWWPPMDFHAGFQLWRELGQDHRGEAIPFAALTAIHMAHRLWAIAIVAAMLGLAWHLWRQAPALRPQTRWLALGALWQLLSGLSNVVLDWPLLAAVAHTGGAAALVVAFTGLLLSVRAQGAGATSSLDHPRTAGRTA